MRFESRNQCIKYSLDRKTLHYKGVDVFWGFTFSLSNSGDCGSWIDRRSMKFRFRLISINPRSRVAFEKNEQLDTHFFGAHGIVASILNGCHNKSSSFRSGHDFHLQIIIIILKPSKTLDYKPTTSINLWKYTMLLLEMPKSHHVVHVANKQNVEMLPHGVIKLKKCNIHYR